ncbi:VOC family protein [Primorskyibacter sp. S187A]|uniref:VOC family protein n=1 Tax=Primorskyibacter sp. S187A TaxID=3415130 RepID=UPI003C7C6E69
MRVLSLDHLVLTVADIPTTCAFYEDVLGMRASAFQPASGPSRWALHFGEQKINLHEAGREFEPKADRPTAGSADLCFLASSSVEDWQAHLKKHAVAIEEGPVCRTGATGPILSFYIRDPDQNLIEISFPT